MSSELNRNQKKAINAAESLSEINTPENNSFAFGTRCLIAGCLPYRKPKDNTLINGTWVRQNGVFELNVQGGKNGLPFGTYPRLFSIWLTGEAIKTQSRIISTGSSSREFFKKIGVDNSRGKRGSGTRLKEQIELFLDCRISYREYLNGSDNKQRLKATENLQVSDSRRLFWDETKKSEEMDCDWYIKLSENFFNELTKHCIPLDLRSVQALRGSPIALDIYQWLAYRLHYLKGSAFVTWGQLNAQFGSNYGQLCSFKRNFNKQLKLALTVYSNAKVKESNDGKGLLLYNSPPPVPKKLYVVGSINSD